jgi:uncharacterized protein YciI
MKYAAIFSYPNDADLVQRVRPEHRAYLRGVQERGQLVTAGPFTDGSGALIIYEAESEEAVRRLIEEDPFRREGIFLNYTLRPWNQVF